MRKNLYIAGMGLLLAGASSAALIASGNASVATEKAAETRADETFQILGFLPSDGSSVKQIKQISLCVYSEGGNFIYLADESKISEVTLTKEGGEPIVATSLGEQSMDYATYDYLFPIIFPEVTEPGTYTLSVPEGLIVEGEYPEDAWLPVAKEGGSVNEPATATFIVDPNAKSPLDNYKLIPGPGTPIADLNTLKIAFPDVTGFIYNNEDGVEISATNGEVTYEGSAQADWGSEETYPILTMTFLDPETYDLATFTPGKWTVTFGAGAFAQLGNISPEITAEYDVIAPSETPLAIWKSFPENDSSVKSFSRVDLIFHNSDEGISYNINEDLFWQISIFLDGKDIWTYVDLDEPYTIINDNYTVFPLILENMTAAGDYTITLPKGLFYETKYNEEAEAFLVFPGFAASEETTLLITVDPELPGFLEEPALSPAANTTVSALNSVSLTFDNVLQYIPVNIYGMGDITLVNGDKKYLGFAKHANDYTLNSFNIEFIDEATGESAQIGSGEWTLTIPESFFILEGEKNPEIISTYTVLEAVLNPASGSAITELSKFELSFPSAKTAEFVGEGYMISLVKGQSSGIPSFDVEKVADAEVPTFILSPVDGYQDPGPGYLTLTIEEGAFLIDGAEGEEGNSPLVRATYDYQKEISQTYLPEPNSPEALVQSWGYTLGFVFEDGVSPKIVDYSGVEVKFNDTVLTFGTEAECYEGKADCAPAVMDNILTFLVVNPDFQKEGKVTITMKGDAYTLSGKPGFDISHSWDIVMPVNYDVTITPDGGDDEGSAVAVGSFDNIQLVFNNAQKAEVFRASGISLRKTDYLPFLTAEIEEVKDAEKPTFKLNFNLDQNETFTDGLYLLDIYFDTFTVDGVQTWPSDYTNVDRYYIFDSSLGGVDSVMINTKEKVTVYDINGRIILDNQPASRLEELKKGIYVINGKKVVVKK